MSDKLARWWPRLMAVAMILFTSMFALDVFSEGYTIGEMLVALFMHLIPSLLLLAALAVAWRWQLPGGILFLVLAVATVVFFRTYQHWSAFVFITLPIVTVGVLFLLDAWLTGSRHTLQRQ